MKNGFTLLEMMITLLIISVLALVSLPAWQGDNQRILAKEQQRLYLFLRQIQVRVENSNQIWYLILNRDISQQRWCVTAQIKSDTICDCFNPHFCPDNLSAQFYSPLTPQHSMITAKAYYPQKLISFNGTRNSSDSGCFMLHNAQSRTLFSFSNLGRIRFKSDQAENACSGGAEE
ncbi:prepilin-type N-terminal cleavage/methylation domain-containing protein [Lonepinella sp. BR2357]|uniref:prepilin-type N-terminal cleavage/methylation domain-containing protein n=1 Tax=Lonepinella sp. BR2357 TaxID=3434549 RepID=UPI003F6DF66C